MDEEDYKQILDYKRNVSARITGDVKAMILELDRFLALQEQEFMAQLYTKMICAEKFHEANKDFQFYRCAIGEIRFTSAEKKADGVSPAYARCLYKAILPEANDRRTKRLSILGKQKLETADGSITVCLSTANLLLPYRLKHDIPGFVSEMRGGLADWEKKFSFEFTFYDDPDITLDL